MTVLVAAAWAACQSINSITHLGHLLVPSPWLLGATALATATWLMRD
ncbi:MAG: hypothetical protein WBG38_15670 [Nodosilinea sp.]